MLKIRLRRMGSRHRPFYRVVVSDSRRVPTASALEEVGYYNPRTQPVTLKLDLDRVEHWMSNGARPSSTVKKLVTQARSAPVEVPEAPAAEEAEAAPAEAAPAAEEAEAAAEGGSAAADGDDHPASEAADATDETAAEPQAGAADEGEEATEGSTEASEAAEEPAGSG